MPDKGTPWMSPITNTTIPFPLDQIARYRIVDRNGFLDVNSCKMEKYVLR